MVCPCGLKLDHQNLRVGLPNQALPNHGESQTYGKPIRNVVLRFCPIPPGRGFSPELSASALPSKRRRTPLQSTVSSSCQQSPRTRSRSRHAASAPADATAATVASVLLLLLLLLCNCCLLISSVFLGALPSLNCYCADTYITVHAIDGFLILPATSFVSSLSLPSPLILHDSSDSLVSTFQSDTMPFPSPCGLPDSVRLGFVSFHSFRLGHILQPQNTSTPRVESFRDLFSTLSHWQRWSQPRLARGRSRPSLPIIDCIPSPLCCTRDDCVILGFRRAQRTRRLRSGTNVSPPCR